MKRLAATARLSVTTRLSVAVLGLLLSAPALGGSLAGVTLPDSIEVDGQQLVLNGMGLRSKLFIKVYVAGLYLPAKQRNAQQVLAADTARRMHMDFLYDVSKEQMCDAWEEGLEANTPNASAEVEAGFQRLCTMMDGVGKGAKLVITYLPATGTTVAIDGTAKGTVAGKPFADAVLATWIGPKPGPGAGFREDVLGQ
jgi:hypothetical protein